MKLKAEISAVCLCLLSVTVWAGSGSAAQDRLSDNWGDYVTAEDRKRLDRFDTVVKEIEQKFEAAKYDAESRSEYERLQAVKAQPNLPVTERDLTGTWKCRSTQPGSLGVYRYPYFKCTITRSPQGLFIEKVTGSQRFSGYLFKAEQQGYVLLGGESVNDDPQVAYSGIAGTSDKTANVVGRLVRKQDRLVLIGLTENEDYNFFELIR